MFVFHVGRWSSALMVLAAVTAPACAEAPLGTGFSYQGQLRNGNNPANGLHDLRFRLFDAGQGGAQVGAVICADDVSVADGLFTVSLDFGPEFAGQERFLEIEVRADTGLDCANPAGFVMLTPRQPFTAAPNSLFALNATTATNSAQLNGQPAAFYQNASNNNSGTLADARLTSNVAMLNNAQTFTGANTFMLAPSFTAAGSPFSVTGNGLVTNLNADQLDGLDSAAFLQSVPVPLTLSGSSNNHIIRGQNASTANFSSGVYGQSTAASGFNYGVQGANFSPSGTGVYGQAPNFGVIGSAFANSGDAYGVFGQTFSTSGRGVYGEAISLGGTATGTTTGVFGLSTSTDGRGVYGLANAAGGATYGGRFESSSTSGTGVYGEATAAGGTTYGVYGESNSTTGRGVQGLANAATGSTVGVFGQTQSTSGRGVRGLAIAATGMAFGVVGESASTSGRGVSGDATAAAGGTIGVVGHSASGTTGRGVFGHASATGGATAGVFGQSDSTSGAAVFGFANAGTGANFGVRGRTSSADGFGGVFENLSAPAGLTVELSGPNGAISTDGFVHREYAEDMRSCAIPIAYGSISSTGAILSGTGNYTLSHTVPGEYQITITGETYSNAGFTVIANVVSNSVPVCVTVADAGVALLINTWSLITNMKGDAPFHFTVFKTNPSGPG